MAVRTLLFDLGNVLIDFSHDMMCSQIAAVCGVADVQIRRLLLDQGLQLRFERGELSEAEFHQAVERAVNRRVDLLALRRAGADIFRLNEAIIPLLDHWKQNGQRLVLLSNTCVTHYDWVRLQYDVLNRFDDCVLSFQVGATKPEEAIFQSALRTIGCAPQECFYTDDVAAYVERGRAMGLQAEVYNDVPTLVRQLEQRGVDCCHSPVSR
jgi:putative hydrolase of the HAD superfamily